MSTTFLMTKPTQLDNTSERHRSVDWKPGVNQPDNGFSGQNALLKGCITKAEHKQDKAT